MRKGEKLLKSLYKRANPTNKDMSLPEDCAMQEVMLMYLGEMKDEEFDKIIN